jgi:transposase
MKKTKKVQQKRVSSNFSVGAAAPTEWEEFQTGMPVYSTRARVPSAQSTKSEQLLKEIRRKTKRVFSAEQKIIIVMEGIRGETSIAELCRRYGIAETTYYKWNKEFVEAGKRRLSGDEARQATSSEVSDLRKENLKLKESLADLVIRYEIVKKIQEIQEHYSSSDDI